MIFFECIKAWCNRVSREQLEQDCKDACDYVNHLIRISGSREDTNSLDEPYRLSVIRSVFDMRQHSQNMVTQHSGNLRMEFIIRLCDVVKYSTGNCGEFTDLALAFFIQKRVTYRIEQYQVANVAERAQSLADGTVYNSKHIFLVLNRATRSNPRDHATWGKNAFVLDTQNQMFFPASEIDDKLLTYRAEDIVMVPDSTQAGGRYHSFTNVIEPFDSGRDGLFKSSRSLNWFSKDFLSAWPVYRGDVFNGFLLAHLYSEVSAFFVDNVFESHLERKLCEIIRHDIFCALRDSKPRSCFSILCSSCKQLKEYIEHKSKWSLFAAFDRAFGCFYIHSKMRGRLETLVKKYPRSLYWDYAYMPVSVRKQVAQRDPLKPSS